MDRELARQLNGASLSVVANIAEGFVRGRDKEFIQFLRIAQGSNGEVRALLYVAGDRGYLDPQTIDRLVRQTSSIGRMIKRLELYLRSCTEGPKNRKDQGPKDQGPKDPRT